MRTRRLFYAAAFAWGVTLCALAAVLGGCATLPPAPAPIPPPVAGSCEDACLRLADLGCRAGEVTPAGEPCSDVCRAVEEGGLATWDPPCVARAASCAAADACARAR